MSSIRESSLLVVKFGGTALATPGRLRRAAARLEGLRRRGHTVIAVVSAAAGTTDRILDWLAQLCGGVAADREADRALATGEALSAALLAAALGSRGVLAQSLSGGEAGLRATGTYGAGELRDLDPAALRLALQAGVLPVVAGFQAALLDSGQTVTLGRGASDLTAVFLAAQLSADECHIVTDVDGVYAGDPRQRRAAVRFASLSHVRLCELAHAGARVVQAAAADLARERGVRLRIYHYRASVDCPGGTTVGQPSLDGELSVSA